MEKANMPNDINQVVTFIKDLLNALGVLVFMQTAAFIAVMIMLLQYVLNSVRGK